MNNTECRTKSLTSPRNRITWLPAFSHFCFHVHIKSSEITSIAEPPWHRKLNETMVTASCVENKTQMPHVRSHSSFKRIILDEFYREIVECAVLALVCGMGMYKPIGNGNYYAAVSSVLIQLVEKTTWWNLQRWKKKKTKIRNATIYKLENTEWMNSNRMPYTLDFTNVKWNISIYVEVHCI